MPTPIFSPLNGWITIERDEVEQKAGDIFLPDQAKAVVTTGTVLHAAPDVTLVTPGDRVFWPPYAGEEIATPLKNEDGSRHMLFALQEKDLSGLLLNASDPEPDSQ